MRSNPLGLGRCIHEASGIIHERLRSDMTTSPKASRGRQLKISKIVLAVLFACYLGSYIWLSRRGYAEADRYHSDGFYYITPENSNSWTIRNRSCVYLYFPLNFVDRILGLGRSPACDPLMELSESPLQQKTYVTDGTRLC